MFSNAEQGLIQGVWRNVSEDYAPFDVDVTTEDPGFDALDRADAADVRYGTRALVTNDTVVGTTCGGCGGIAYLSVFDSVHGSTYQPAFVFGNLYFENPKDIAEAVSHEVGHNLGLNHDGTSSVEYYSGSGAWAPIMGTGYTEPIVQWSKGEYPDANNHEDDLAVIASNGVTPVPDDHGDLKTTATALGALPTGATGEIGTAADTDWFSFVAPAGTTTVSVAPSGVTPNLDTRLTLYNAAAAVVASSDPPSAFVSPGAATGLDASVTASLSAGTYYVQIEGVGSGNVATDGYSDYASLGRYSLAISAGSGPAIASRTLAPSVAGLAYDQLLAAAGGTAPLTWSRIAGALPAGVTLDSNGVLSGVPTGTTPATFTLKVTDASARSATRAFTIDPTLKVTSRDLPDVTVGDVSTRSATAAGGFNALRLDDRLRVAARRPHVERRGYDLRHAHSAGHFHLHVTRDRRRGENGDTTHDVDRCRAVDDQSRDGARRRGRILLQPRLSCFRRSRDARMGASIRRVPRRAPPRRQHG